MVQVNAIGCLVYWNLQSEEGTMLQNKKTQVSFARDE